MKADLRMVRIVAGMVALALGSAACTGDPSDGRPGQGVVLAVDTEDRRITLDHEEIPGMMKAMTMTFEVAPEVELEGLAPGQEVEFRLVEEGGVYTVTSLGSEDE